MGTIKERLVWLPAYVLSCAAVGILAYFATYSNLKVGLVTAALGAVFGALGWLMMQIPQRPRCFRIREDQLDLVAFTEANRQHVDPDACACRVDDGEIVRCALHGAAPDLLKQLEKSLLDIEDFVDEDGEYDFTSEAGRKMAGEIRKAIDSAKERR